MKLLELGTVVVLGLAATVVALQHATTVSEQFLPTGLRVDLEQAADPAPYDPSGLFRVIVRNQSRDDFAVCRWRWTWELTIVRDGVAISNERQWRDEIHKPVWTDRDWIVLRPGDTHSFLTASHSAEGPISDIRRGDVIRLRLLPESVPSAPDWITRDERVRILNEMTTVELKVE